MILKFLVVFLNSATIAKVTDLSDYQKVNPNCRIFMTVHKLTNFS